MTREQEIHRLIFLKYQIMWNALETCKETLEHEFTEIDKLKAEYRNLTHGEYIPITNEGMAPGSRI